MNNRYDRNRLPDRSQEMIDETSQFLTWALCQNVQFPRIPIRRADKGGFCELLRVPGARAAVYHWWGCAFKWVEDR